MKFFEYLPRHLFEKLTEYGYAISSIITYKEIVNQVATDIDSKRDPQIIAYPVTANCALYVDLWILGTFCLFWEARKKKPKDMLYYYKNFKKV